MTTEPGDNSAAVEMKDRLGESHTRIAEVIRELGAASDLGGLLQRLREFRAFVAPHFLEEEEPDGFFDIVRTRSSRHVGRVKQLEGEHLALLEQIDRLAARARACLDGPVAEILRAAGDLGRRLAEHEAAECALLIEALYVDIGAEE